MGGWAGRLVGRSVGRSNGGRVGWAVNRGVGWGGRVGSSVGRSVGRSVHRSVIWLVYRSVGRFGTTKMSTYMFRHRVKYKLEISLLRATIVVRTNDSPNLKVSPCLNTPDVTFRYRISDTYAPRKNKCSKPITGAARDEEGGSVGWRKRGLPLVQYDGLAQLHMRSLVCDIRRWNGSPQHLHPHPGKRLACL